MIRSELYKIRHHRTPWVLTALLAVGLAAGPAVMIFRQPAEVGVYTDVLTSIFALAALIVGAVFGGWLFGHEYRQGTVQRMFSLDAGRLRLFAAKAGVGLVALAAALAVSAGFGALTTWGAAAINGDTLVWDGVIRSFLSTGFLTAVVAAVAYATSVVFRNDTYAMLVPIGLIIVFQPLLALIPGVGEYLIGSTAGLVSDDIAGSYEFFDSSSMGVGEALAWTGAWIGGLGAAGAALLQRRDV